MKRVLDSSVGFKWVVPELHSDKALSLRDDYRNGILELIAPDTCLIEIVPSLSRYHGHGKSSTVLRQELIRCIAASET